MEGSVSCRLSFTETVIISEREIADNCQLGVKRFSRVGNRGGAWSFDRHTGTQAWGVSDGVVGVAEGRDVGEGVAVWDGVDVLVGALVGV